MNKISTKDRAGRAKPLEKPKISTTQQKIAPDLADIIVNPDNHTVYKRGKFLGKKTSVLCKSNFFIDEKHLDTKVGKLTSELKNGSYFQNHLVTGIDLCLAYAAFNEATKQPALNITFLWKVLFANFMLKSVYYIGNQYWYLPMFYQKALGGFAKCYEMTDQATKITYAGKIVPKSLLTKSHQRDKMAQEIQIHRELNNKHIVGFHSYFEDPHYVYIILELCRKRSMMELHKRRRALTEPEVRFYMTQIIDACIFLHGKHIIHRDLKLGNLFLNDDFQVKIGDFGLATKVDFDGERKKTLCGTPNYIAPEVLCKKGHSFEVDVWSVGCILYTLLVGKPPFETTSLKETYQRIKQNEYYIPSKVPQSAQMLIIKMLRPEPNSRPTMKEIRDDRFFSEGFIPTSLPNSSLTMAPRFSISNSNERKPLIEVNRELRTGLASIPEIAKPKGNDRNNVSHAVFVRDGLGHNVDEDPEKESDGEPDDFYLARLSSILRKVIASKCSSKDDIDMDEAEDPALTPVTWISKWVDYSDRYGLGYQLSGGCGMGVLFNDETRLLMHEDKKTLQYIDKNNQESFHNYDTELCHLKKKKKLLDYFNTYMSDHLVNTGSGVETKERVMSERLPFLRRWFRTTQAMVLHLNIGILQINYFLDHVKLIICPKMEAVSYINKNREFRTYKLSALSKYGCTVDLYERLKYAVNIVDQLQKKLVEEKNARLLKREGAC